MERLSISFPLNEEIRTYLQAENSRNRKDTYHRQRNWKYAVTLSPTHLIQSAFIVEKGETDAEGIPAWFELTGAGWGHGVGFAKSVLPSWVSRAIITTKFCFITIKGQI